MKIIKFRFFDQIQFFFQKKIRAGLFLSVYFLFLSALVSGNTAFSQQYTEPNACHDNNQCTNATFPPDSPAGQANNFNNNSAWEGDKPQYQKDNNGILIGVEFIEIPIGAHSLEIDWSGWQGGDVSISVVEGDGNNPELLYTINSQTGTESNLSIPGEYLTNNDELYILIEGNNSSQVNLDMRIATEEVTDEDPPTFDGAESNPADGTEDVEVDANFELAFSETVVAGSGGIQLIETGGSIIETFTTNTGDGTDGGSVTFDGSTVTLNPGSDLSGGTSYHVTIDDGAIEDEAENSFGGIDNTTDYNFETAVIPPHTITLEGPSEVTAGSTSGNFTITVRDNDGEITQVSQNTIFNLSTDEETGTASFDPDDAIQISAGQSSVTFTYSNTQVGSGSHTISASRTSGATFPGGGNDTHDITIEAGSVDELLVVTDPSETIAGEAIEGPPEVLVTDSNGNPVQDVDVVVSIQGGGSFAGGIETVTLQSNVNGIASFDDLLLNIAGSYIFVFDAAGVTENATTTEFDVVAASAETVSVETQPDETIEGESIKGPPQALVEDEFDNPVQGVDVTVSIQGGGSFAGGIETVTVQTDASGIASFNDLVLNTPDSYILVFNATDVTGDATTTVFDVIQITAEEVSVSEQPTETTAGETIEGPPAALVVDASDNPVEGVNVTVSIQGGGEFDGGATTVTVPTDATGIASFDDLVINIAGNYNLVFDAEGVDDDAISDGFDVVVGEASKIILSSPDPANVTAGEVSGNFVLELQDDAGNTVEADGPITFNVSSNSGGSTNFYSDAAGENELDPAQVTINNTQTNVEFYYGDEEAGNKTITATWDSGGNNVGPDDVAISVESAAPDEVLVETEPSQTTAGIFINGPPEALVVDEFDNPVEGVNVTVSLQGGGDFYDGTETVQTNASGIASFDDLELNSAGSYTLVFDATGVIGDVTSSAFNITAGDADAVSMQTEPGQTSAGETIEGPPEVLVEDEFNNPKEGVDVEVSIQGGGNFVEGTTTIVETNASGIARFDNLVLNTPDSYILVFDATGVTIDAESESFEVVPGDPSELIIVTQPEASSTGIPIQGPPTVLVEDAVDNPVPDVEVTVSIQGGGTFEAGDTAIETDENGLASFTDLELDDTGMFTLVFSALGVTDATSDEFEVVVREIATETPLLRYTFDETPTANTEPSIGSVPTDIGMYEESVLPGNLTNLRGPDGSGVSGESGDYALDLTTPNGHGGEGGFAVTDVDVDEVDELSSFTLLGWYYSENIIGNQARLIEDNSGSQGFTLWSEREGQLQLIVDSQTFETDAVFTSTNEWVFFAVSYDGVTGNAVFYKGTSDGELLEVDSGTISDVRTADNDEGFGLGSEKGTKGKVFNGLLDDMRIYGSKDVNISAAMSSEEVEEVQDEALPPEVTDVTISEDSENLVLTFRSTKELTEITASIDGPNTEDIYSFDEGNFVENVIGEDVYEYTLTGSYTFNDGAGEYTFIVEEVLDEDDLYSKETPLNDTYEFVALADATNSTITAAPEEGVTADGVVSSILTITLRDTNNNVLGADEDVFFVITAGEGGALSDGPWTTDENGEAVATLTSTAANSVTVTGYLGSDGEGEVIGTAQVEFIAGDAVAVSVDTEPGETIAGNLIAGPPSALIVDANSNPVEGVDVTVSIAGEDEFDGGTYTVASQANGIAEFNDLVINTTGTYTLVFNAAGVDDDASSASFDVIPAEPDAGHTSIQASPIAIEANGVTTSTITLMVRDGQGNIRLEGGDDVYLNTDHGSLDSATPTDNEDGTYTATLTSSASIETATVTGYLGTDSEGAEIGTATVDFTAGQATQIVFTTESRTITAGGTSDVISIELRDVNGHTATSVATTTVDLSSDHTGTFRNEADDSDITTVTITEGNSAASFRYTSTVVGDGTHELSAEDAGESLSLATQNMTVNPAAGYAGTSTITAADGSLTADGSSTTTITVQLKDEYSNNLTTGENTVSLSTSAGTLSDGDSGANGAQDVAALDEGDGTYTATLTSSANVETATISGALDEEAIDDTEIVAFTSGAISIGESGSQISGQDIIRLADGAEAATITVQLKDDNGNHIEQADVEVIFSTTLGDLSSETAVTTDGTGVASVTLSSTQAGTADVTATVDTGEEHEAVTNGSPVEVTFMAGDARELVITEQPGPTTAGEAVTGPPTVRVEDAQNNPVEGVQVSVALNDGIFIEGSTVALTSGADGLVTFDNLVIEAAGTYTLTFNVVDDPDPEIGVESDEFTVTTTGIATQLALSGDTDELVSGSTRELTATLLDEFNNIVSSGEDSGLEVEFTKSAGDGTVTGLSAETAVAGIAVIELTGGLPGPVTITASTAGALSDDLGFTVAVGEPDAGNTSIAASPIEIEANGVTTSTITVTVRDGQGNIRVDGGDDVFLTTDHGSLDSATPTDNDDGTYTATLTSSSSVETATVTGYLGTDSEGAEIGTATVDFTVQLVDADNSSVSAAPLSVMANGVAVTTLTMEVNDADDIAITGLGQGDFDFNGISDATAQNFTEDGDGVYTIEFTNTTVEDITIQVDVNEVNIGSTEEISFTSQLADGGNSSVAADPLEVTANGVASTTLTIQVNDGDDEAITGLEETDFAFNNTSEATSQNFTEVGDGTYTIDFTNTTVEDITIQVDAGEVNIGSTQEISFTGQLADGDNSSVSAAPLSVMANGVAITTLTIQVNDSDDVAITGLVENDFD
ncbi:MAG: invasin domain 3-containing protein, partial [Balneolales bacterium]